MATCYGDESYRKASVKCPVCSPCLVHLRLIVFSDDQQQGRSIKKAKQMPHKSYVGQNCAVFSQCKQGVHCRDTAIVKKN